MDEVSLYRLEQKEIEEKQDESRKSYKQMIMKELGQVSTFLS